MKTQVRHGVGAFILVGAMAVMPTSLLLGSGPANSDSAADCPTVGADGLDPEAADGAQADTCDLVGEVVATDTQMLAIPPPGLVVGVTDFREDGQEAELTIETASDGTVQVDAVDETDPRATTPPDGADPCIDNYTVPTIGRKWYVTSKWYINRGTIPTDDISADNAVTEIRSGIQNITGADNTCGMTDNVSADAAYQGDTNAKSPISYGCDPSTGQCQTLCPSATNPGNDNQNTVYFGTRQAGVLASTCSIGKAHDGPNAMVEVDMEIDKAHTRWTPNGGASSCQNQYDLQSVTTHEFGHWFGLAHASATRELAAQTMYPAGWICDTTMRTPGAGDVRGLRQYY